MLNTQKSFMEGLTLYEQDIIVTDFLEHHGILGMKWGIRRYQNADGSLTAAGAKRYGTSIDEGRDKMKAKIQKDAEKRAEKVKKQKAKTAEAVAKEKQKQKILKEKEKVAEAKKKAQQAKIDTKQAKKLQKENAKLEKRMAELDKHRKEILSDPKKVYDNFDLLTKEEIQNAVKAFETKGKLIDFKKKQREAGADYLQTLVKYSTNGIMVYNNVARIVNSFSDREKDLPYIPMTTSAKPNNKK